MTTRAGNRLAAGLQADARAMAPRVQHVEAAHHRTPTPAVSICPAPIASHRGIG
jgi:hypothetical protein